LARGFVSGAFLYRASQRPPNSMMPQLDRGKERLDPLEVCFAGEGR
jgi:hypothetical protein